MKKTCTNCKYFDACGDEERTMPCKGHSPKRIYHMVVENIHTGQRKEYLSATQGSTPSAEWKCVGVCGYHEKVGER